MKARASAWAALVVCLLGCYPEPRNAVEALEAKCAGDARAEYYVGQASVDQAMRVYDACIARGLADGGADVPR